jgi:endonuclease/exonuclease/phosphatase (EEP) superfamily protein YafD
MSIITKKSLVAAGILTALIAGNVAMAADVPAGVQLALPTAALLMQEAQTTPELVRFATTNYLAADQVPAFVLPQHPSGVMTLSAAHPVYSYSPGARTECWNYAPTVNGARPICRRDRPRQEFALLNVHFVRPAPKRCSIIAARTARVSW